jgi:hypothetical protein
MVSLKFPNARLFIKNLVANEQRTGAQAMILAAAEFGLINPGSVNHLNSALNGNKCQCMTAAKAILREHSQSSCHIGNFTSQILSKIETDLEHDLAAHRNAEQKKKKGKPTVTKRNSLPDRNCQKDAPVVFDMLLQQIHSHV